jgi:hypothetical protein
MIEEEDLGLTFSDADFERRYSSEEASGAASSSRPAASATEPSAQTGRSPNRFMRTLLRRRLAASGRT